MSANEIKTWIENLVDQISGTDWWANIIAILCAIIGGLIPILYEMHQRRKVDNKIQGDLKESTEKLIDISKKLEKEDDKIKKDLSESINHLASISENLKMDLRKLHQNRFVFSELCHIFEKIDSIYRDSNQRYIIGEVIGELKNIIDYPEYCFLQHDFEELVRILEHDFEELVRILEQDREVEGYYYKKYNRLKYRLLKKLMEHI